MDKESQRRYRGPSRNEPASTGEQTQAPSRPSALRSFLAGFWNERTGAGLTPEEWLSIQQDPSAGDRVNWLHHSNLPPQLRSKLRRYYQSGHGVDKSMLYNVVRYINRMNRSRKR